LRKTIIGLVLSLALISLLAVPAFAAGKSSLAGKSNVGHLSLYEKDSTDWSVVEDGAWGQFNYKLSGEGEGTKVSGVFNGHGLEQGEDYSLIYYPETAPNPWPAGGVEVVVIGEGIANEDGDVHIMGKATIALPDRHTDPQDVDYYPRELGDKIWLVLSSDLMEKTYDDGSTHTHIVGWHSDEYLFEDALINTGLLLCEKDSDWGIVEDGAWGIYNYRLSRGGKATQVSGIFYGYGLEDGTSYSLIYYPEPAPNPWVGGEYEVVVIGDSVAEGGKVEITGSATIGFPDEQPEVGDYVGQTGDKIWLVLSDDLEGGVMTAWNPSEYLFEAKLINTDN